MSNEAAERLAACIRQDCEHFDAAACIRALPAALLAERKATVERIRTALRKCGLYGNADAYDDLAAILDAEAAR